MPAWRARAHRLTRSRAFLGKAAGIILGVCALVATLLHLSRPPDDVRAIRGMRMTAQGSFLVIVREGAMRLEAMREPAPGQLLAWIREAASAWQAIEPVEKKVGFDPAALRIGGVELHPLISKHTTSAAQADAVGAYARFRFLPEGEAREAALHDLWRIVREAPPPLANEMLGDALMRLGRIDEALRAYMQDVGLPDATHARREAFRLAGMRRDIEALHHLCSEERVVAEVDPASLWVAAKLTGNRPLLFRALWRMQRDRWMEAAAVPLALLAAAIWYVILVHTASRESWRWWRHLPGVLAGMASVWLLKWLQGTLDYLTNPEKALTPSHEILQWIMHVGLPEEGAKLLLFAFFLPVLLHHRSGAKAALTAGCVGLGFALEENLHYFVEHGSEVAIGRLITANFMHVSLTGIIGWHLYELFRSRFHHAVEFLIAFCVVVVAHGVYDFSLGSVAAEWGIDLAHIIILALCAKFYLPMLHEAGGAHPGGHHITRTAVFVLGTVLLGGILMIVTVWEHGSLEGITVVLAQLIGVALVGLIYIREWRELD